MNAGHRTAVGIVIAFFVSSCAPAQNGERVRLRDRLATRTAEPVSGAVERTLSSAGRQRSYLLLNASRSGNPAPLVITLHGGGGNGGTMIPRWQAKASTEGLIIAAPNGVGRKDGVGTWNADGCCGEAMTSNSDDVHFISAVIDDVARTANVDRSRIYVVGMSNGGMLTHRVAIALSDRLAAAAVVAGAMFGDEQLPPSSVPVLIMHGVVDQVVGYQGGMSPTGFVARAQSKPFEPVQYAVDFWRRADGCVNAPTVTKQGDVTIETSAGCRAGSEVRFYRLGSANHTWPGGTTSGSPVLEGNHYDAISATDVIWDFFKSHSRVQALR